MVVPSAVAAGEKLPVDAVFGDCGTEIAPPAPVVGGKAL